jgi:hypothetical protein
VPESGDRELEMEGRLFGRYLVGRQPPPELVVRYREANRILLGGSAPGSEVAVVAFARRHPWSIPFLDSAAGLVRPGSLLRNKILVMAAVLEASPTFAEEFLSRTVHPVSLVLRVLGLGTLAVARAAVGVLVYAAASRSRA